MKKTLPLYVVLIALSLYVAWLWLAGGAGVGGIGTRPAVPVTTQAVEMRAMGEVISALGTAQSKEGVLITSQQTGLVEQLHFKDGEIVQTGQLLVTLHDDEERARVRESEAKLADNRSQLERLQNLSAGNAVSKSVLDEKIYAVKVAEAQLEVAKATLQKRYITAPFSGVLGTRQVSPGALVTTATAITTLDDLSKMKVEFTIPETFASVVKPGLEVVAISAAFSDQLFSGVISHVDARINPGTRTLSLLAQIDNPKRLLKPGMLVEVRISQDKTEVLTVPEGALISLARQHYVFVVDENNLAKQKQIVIGKRRIGFAEVIEGLALGDRVVVEGTHKIRDGQPVNISNTETQP